VAQLLARHKDAYAIVDTVMLPTRGRGRLLPERAVRDVRASLVPRAWLVTANVPEAEALTGARVGSVDEAADAAHALCRMGANAALVKGGHLHGKNAVDVLAFAGEIHEIALPRLKARALHGGGCVLASLIAGRIAVRPRSTVLDVVHWAKSVHHASIERAHDVGGDLKVLVPG
jgi:hydroxymethylpyrimidine kinase/phosphomethylpyrimidine kinase